MKQRFIFTFLLLNITTTNVFSNPNFSLTNAADRKLYFSVTGANDLIGLIDGVPQNPQIHTLNPRASFETKITLDGILTKGPQIYFFPPQLSVVPVDISINDDNHPELRDLVLNMPVAGERIYEFTSGKKIYINATCDQGNQAESAEYYSGLVIYPSDQAIDSSYAQPDDIMRGIPFERLSMWAAQEKNHALYREFQKEIYPFVYDYTQSGGFIRYVWRHGTSGISTLMNVWAMKRRMDQELAVDFSQGHDLSWYQRYLGNTETQANQAADTSRSM